MRKILHFLLALAFLLPLVGYTTQANAFNDPPYDFLFGNHIDTHQETQLLNDGNLFGLFYIIFTGAIDPGSGLPIARHIGVRLKVKNVMSMWNARLGGICEDSRVRRSSFTTMASTETITQCGWSTV